MDKNILQQTIPVQQIYDVTLTDDQQTIDRLTNELNQSVSQIFNEPLIYGDWQDIINEIDTIYNNIVTVVKETSGVDSISSTTNLLTTIEGFKTRLRTYLTAAGVTTSSDMSFTDLLELIDDVKQQGGAEQTNQLLNQIRQGLSEHIYASLYNFNNATIDSIIGTPTTYNEGLDNEYVQYNGGVVGQIRNKLINITNKMDQSVQPDVYDHQLGLWSLAESINTQVTDLLDSYDEAQQKLNTFNISDAPNWVSDSSYNIGDIRKYNNNIYISLTNHTDLNGNSNPEDTLNIWQQLT